MDDDPERNPTDGSREGVADLGDTTPEDLEFGRKHLTPERMRRIPPIPIPTAPDPRGAKPRSGEARGPGTDTNPDPT